MSSFMLDSAAATSTTSGGGWVDRAAADGDAASGGDVLRMMMTSVAETTTAESKTATSHRTSTTTTTMAASSSSSSASTPPPSAAASTTTTSTTNSAAWHDQLRQYEGTRRRLYYKNWVEPNKLYWDSLQKLLRMGMEETIQAHKFVFGLQYARAQFQQSLVGLSGPEERIEEEKAEEEEEDGEKTEERPTTPSSSGHGNNIKHNDKDERKDRIGEQQDAPPDDSTVGVAAAALDEKSGDSEQKPPRNAEEKEDPAGSNAGADKASETTTATVATSHQHWNRASSMLRSLQDAQMALKEAMIPADEIRSAGKGGEGGGSQHQQQQGPLVPVDLHEVREALDQLVRAKDVWERVENLEAQVQEAWNKYYGMASQALPADGLRQENNDIINDQSNNSSPTKAVGPELTPVSSSASSSSAHTLSVTDLWLAELQYRRSVLQQVNSWRQHGPEYNQLIQRALRAEQKRRQDLYVFLQRGLPQVLPFAASGKPNHKDDGHPHSSTSQQQDRDGGVSASPSLLLPLDHIIEACQRQMWDMEAIDRWEGHQPEQTYLVDPIASFLVSPSDNSGATALGPRHLSSPCVTDAAAAVTTSTLSPSSSLDENIPDVDVDARVTSVELTAPPGEEEAMMMMMTARNLLQSSFVLFAAVGQVATSPQNTGSANTEQGDRSDSNSSTKPSSSVLAILTTNGYLYLWELAVATPTGPPRNRSHNASGTLSIEDAMQQVLLSLATATWLYRLSLREYSVTMNQQQDRTVDIQRKEETDEVGGDNERTNSPSDTKGPRQRQEQGCIVSLTLGSTQEQSAIIEAAAEIRSPLVMAKS